MPGSFPVFDAVVEHLVQRLAPARMLDVGPGAGKYGQMARRLAPQATLTAVEVESSYVARFGLQKRYHRVHVADIAQWWDDAQDEDGRTERRFDLAILGDLLGHLPKSRGMDLLNRMVFDCAWIVLVVPEFVTEAPREPAPSERHCAVWSERDLHWHDLWAWDNCRATTLMVLRGYPASALTLQQWVDEVQAAQLPVRHFDGATMVRPVRLRLEQALRETDYRLP